MSRRSLGALFVVGAAFVACKFSPSTAPSDGSSDALIDAAPEECTESSKRCLDADTLRTCPAANAQSFDTPCAWGCVETGEAHCGLIAPAGSGVGQVDVDPATAFTGLGDVMLVGDVDGDTGEIAGAATPDGLHYEIKNNMAVFRARKLTIPAASGGVNVLGSRPVIFIADEVITVADTLSAVGCGGGSGTLPGPGGFAGGNTAAAPGAGPGSGAGATAGNDDGGGGAGHGAAGGAGAGADAGDGGTTYGMDTIPVLQGGAGGGAGDGGGNFGRGGGGGGALQLISNTAIVIATGGVINAGGCGGSRGGGGSDGGGGGGAGGTILIEAPSVTIAGTLAVNGGGGGGGGGGAAGSGSAGQPTRTAASGGTADSNRTGGVGGVGGTAGGAGGAANTVADIGGGGGGGVGRIRVNSKPGAMATVMAGSVMSPSFQDSGTTATQGAADVR